MKYCRCNYIRPHALRGVHSPPVPDCRCALRPSLTRRPCIEQQKRLQRLVARATARVQSPLEIRDAKTPALITYRNAGSRLGHVIIATGRVRLFEGEREIKVQGCNNSKKSRVGLFEGE